MKKTCALLLAVLMIFSLFACGSSAQTTSPAAPSSAAPSSAAPSSAAPVSAAPSPAAPSSAAPASSGEKRSIGFVLMGLGNEFFMQLADAYEKAYTEAGWDATYVDGKMDVATQITACENYIAKKVDVLVIFALSGKALSQVAEQAMAAGVKVISFVELTDKFDAAMTTSSSEQGYAACKLAARQWVDKTFPDAAPGSVKCVVMPYYKSDTQKDCSEALLNIEKVNPKIKIIDTYEVQNEDTATGVTAAEDIFAKHPDVQLILPEAGTLALGVNNYLTSLSSPVKEYAQIGIFSVNGASAEIFAAIQASADDKAPLRGINMAGGIPATIADFTFVVNGVLDGSLKQGYVKTAKLELITAATIGEFFASGTVNSLLLEDLPYKTPNE